MAIIIQLSLLFTLTLLGDLIASILPFAFPGNIIGMALLIAFLGLKWLEVDSLSSVADFMLKNMAFFFIPAGVGILKNQAIFDGTLLRILIVCISSTAITFIVTALVAKTIITYQKRRRGSTND